MPRLTACLLALALLVVAAPARAATALERARAEAQSSRARVNDVRGRQMELRRELNEVAGRIEALKSQQKRGADLDGQLRRSQELSGSLAEAAQELSRAETEAERENLALLTALGGELDRVLAQVERTQDRKDRAKLYTRMKDLRDEREQIRLLLPAAKVPALDARGSDDPEDLLQQADMLRDSEDKLRQKLRSLEGRLRELREEREMDRRLGDFMRDDLFDDHDRRLVVDRETNLSRGTHPPLASAQSEADTFSAAPHSEASQVGGAPPSDRSKTSDQPAGTSGLTHQGNVTQIARGADSRPQLGGMDARALQSLETRDISQLEAELKRLRKLASDLDARAAKLEQRARE